MNEVILICYYILLKGGITLTVITHSKMGTFLYKYICKNTKLLINKKSFVYGNIKPDIDKKLRSFPHRIDYLMGYLQNMIIELTTEKYKTEDFSEKLGIICHFLCDTFCSFHFYDDLWEKGIYEHLLYEIKLHQMFRSMKKNSLKIDLAYSIKNFDQFKTIYLILRNEYINDFDNMANNIKYALKFSMLVIELIQDGLQKNRLLEAA